jgi:diaminopimelate epimerase
VEACGNATRCLGWLFLQESKRDVVVIDTLGRSAQVPQGRQKKEEELQPES